MVVVDADELALLTDGVDALGHGGAKRGEQRLHTFKAD
jgi:hypothetical protein